MAITADTTASANDFVDEGSRDSATPANDAGKGVKLESDGRLGTEFFKYAFGNGYDGDVVLDGTNTYGDFTTKSSSTYTLTRDIYAENLTIGSGVTLDVNGYRVFVADTLDGSGTIKYPDGNNGADGNDWDVNSGAGGAGGSNTVDGWLKNTSGASGGSGNTSAPGGDGSNGSINDVAANTGNGGDGGDSDDGQAGGSGGSVGSVVTNSVLGTVLAETVRPINIANDGTTEVKTHVGAGGGGGGGDGDGPGGGGGGAGASGGIVVIGAQNFEGSFTIQAIGGNGGNGGDGGAGAPSEGGGGGGAGGIGGTVIVVYGSKSWTGTYNVSGGTGGTGGAGGDAQDGDPGQNGDTGKTLELDVKKLL